MTKRDRAIALYTSLPRITQEAVGRIVGADQTTVSHWLIEAGIPARTIGRRISAKNEAYRQQALIAYEAGMSASDIKKVLNLPVSRRTISNWILRAGKSRNRSEAATAKKDYTYKAKRETARAMRMRGISNKEIAFKLSVTPEFVSKWTKNLQPSAR